MAIASTGQTGTHSAQPVQAPASTRGRAPPGARANRIAPAGQASRHAMQEMPRKARQDPAMAATGLGGGPDGEVEPPNRSLRRPRSRTVSWAMAAPLTPAPVGR